MMSSEGAPRAKEIVSGIPTQGTRQGCRGADGSAIAGPVRSGRMGNGRSPGVHRQLQAPRLGVFDVEALVAGAAQLEHERHLAGQPDVEHRAAGFEAAHVHVLGVRHAAQRRLEHGERADLVERRGLDDDLAAEQRALARRRRRAAAPGTSRARPRSGGGAGRRLRGALRSARAAASSPRRAALAAAASWSRKRSSSSSWSCSRPLARRGRGAGGGCAAAAAGGGGCGAAAARSAAGGTTARPAARAACARAR